MKKIILFLLLSFPFLVMAQQKEEQNPKPATTEAITAKPLYILDGKIVDESAVTGKYAKENSNKLVFSPDPLDPNEIERVSVLKGDSALVKYGEAGKNGVVVITTKAYLKKSGKY